MARPLIFLIVDDSRSNRMLYFKMLTRSFETCEVRESEFGCEGLTHCLSDRIDCVLLDFELPDIDGIEFLRRLKNTEKEMIPVIMTTAHGSEAIAVKALKGGAQDYLVKGTFDRETLARAVRSAMNRVALEREKQRERLILERTNLNLKREMARRILLHTDPSIDGDLASTGLVVGSQPLDELCLLIIDDDKAARCTYLRLLKGYAQQKFRFLFAETGTEGLKIIEQERVDCIFLDFHLPEANGLTFLNELIATPVERVPVIMLTAQGNEALAVEAIRSGAQDYLGKDGLTAEKLIHAMYHAIGQVRLIREVKRHREELETRNQELKREIAEREKADANLRLFRDLINQSDDFLFIMEPDSGTILYFNEATCRILGFEAKKLASMKVGDVDSDVSTKARWRDRLAILHETRKGIFESVYRCRDGREIQVEVNIRLVHQHGQDYLVSVARDISERKKVEDKLRMLSTLDGLTGVYNRRYLDDTLKSEWGRLRRERVNIALIMIDVDFFKKYNDSYGHQAGDECLKKIACCLRDTLRRASDFVARYGGEEFAVVLPNTSLDGAEAIAEKFRNEIESLNLEYGKSPVSDRVTISLGVADMVPRHGNSAEDLIKIADKALYRAKEKGRNCMVSQGESPILFSKKNKMKPGSSR